MCDLNIELTQNEIINSIFDLRTQRNKLQNDKLNILYSFSEIEEINECLDLYLGALRYITISNKMKFNIYQFNFNDYSLNKYVYIDYDLYLIFTNECIQKYIKIFNISNDKINIYYDSNDNKYIRLLNDPSEYFKFTNSNSYEIKIINIKDKLNKLKKIYNLDLKNINNKITKLEMYNDKLEKRIKTCENTIGQQYIIIISLSVIIVLQIIKNTYV